MLESRCAVGVRTSRAALSLLCTSLDSPSCLGACLRAFDRACVRASDLRCKVSKLRLWLCACVPIHESADAWSCDHIEIADKIPVGPLRLSSHAWFVCTRNLLRFLLPFSVAWVKVEVHRQLHQPKMRFPTCTLHYDGCLPFPYDGCLPLLRSTKLEQFLIFQ